MNQDSHHHPRSIRLRGYPYSSPGAYFVTICICEKNCLLGNIQNHEMHLNPYGQIVKEEWLRSASIRKEIQLDSYTIMPNHLHGIVIIAEVNLPHLPMAIGQSGSQADSPVQRGPAKHSLGGLVAGFKSSATKRINELRGTPGIPVWQRNYYEHIIRNTRSLEKIRKYIDENPLRWEADFYYNHSPGRPASRPYNGTNPFI